MKKLISTILAGTMIVGLCACGNKQDTPKDTSSDQSVEVEAEGEEEIDEDTEETIAAGSSFVNDGNTVYCSLDGMSADDIFDNLMNAKNFAEGTTYIDYFTKFDYDDGTFTWNKDYGDRWDYANDAKSSKINYVGLEYLYPFDANSNVSENEALTFQNKSLVQIEFYVADLDTGYAVYDKFMEYYATIGVTSETEDFGLLHGSVKADECVFFSVTLQTNDAGPYTMTVELPCSY